MPVPYQPLAIANQFIIDFGAATGVEHMKLQKLVYFAHGFWLAAYNGTRAALVNERPEVWKHGPVFGSMYQALKVFGSEPILKPQSANPFATPPVVDDDDAEVKNLVAWVWSRYGHLSSFALSDLTHSPGTSWSRVAKEHDYSVPFNLEIPDDYIVQEFKVLLDGEPAGAQANGRQGTAQGGRQAQA